MTTTDDDWDREVDLLVLGSGAGGLGAAVVGANEGLQVLVLEKSEFVGGTTAYSAGTCWIPDNRFQRADGVTDDAEAARGYLDALVGDRSPRRMRETYLRRGTEMIDYLDEIGVRFWPSKKVVDYHPELPGAGMGGRALESVTFDGRRLGRASFRRVRGPVPEFALFGGTLMLRRAEVNELLTIYEGSLRSVPLAFRLGLRWAIDRLRFRRGTRLAMGNALVANLFCQLLARGADVWFSADTTELLGERGRVEGACVTYRGRRLRVRARRGVVLAGGGFAASAEHRMQHLPAPTARFTRAAEGATGDTLALGQSVGGALGSPHDDNAFWFPSSVGRRRDGSTAVFPHIWDRAKPGLVAVNDAGRRFTDEAVSYHRFTRAMYASHEAVPTIPAWLVVDSRTLTKYGLGMVRPHLPALLRKKYEATGYLVTARTVRELAAAIGVDSSGLEQTIADNNRYARTGRDEQFGKGENPFDRQYGDQEHQPNPNLGPIEVPPYYAIAVVPTPLGTALGLRTDPEARVLTESGTPVEGLFACGNDADSVMAAEYPGAGCQVGSALTFGYIAARHAAQRS